MDLTGDDLVGFLGHATDEPLIQSLWTRLGVPWRPEVRPGQPNDWMRIENVEIGFEALQVFLGRSIDGESWPILQQICVYRPSSANTDPMLLLPASLTFSLNRAVVREQLTASRARYGRRDAFDDGDRTLVVSYDEAEAIDSVLVLAARPRRTSALQVPLTLSEIEAAIGSPWYDESLRERFNRSTGSLENIAEVKRHGALDLVEQSGVRLLYDRRHATAILAGAEFYAPRVRNAATWADRLPLELNFDMCPLEAVSAIDGECLRSVDGELESYSAWRVGQFDYVVTFDLIVNSVASVAFAKAGYWPFEVGAR